MKKPVSSPYGWEPTKIVQVEQCICCKNEIVPKPGEMAYRSKQPTQRSFLDNECYQEWVKMGANQPLFWHPRYRAEGRITKHQKGSRAARERELEKGHVLKS